MKKIKDWHDLAPYGIIWLTREQDPYYLRVTVDLTEEGKELIKEFFNMKDASFWGNWNSGATGSMMLPNDIFVSLAKFILYHVEKVKYLIVSSDGVREINEDYYQKYLEAMKIYEEMGVRVCENPNSEPGRNTNRYYWTGREK